MTTGMSAAIKNGTVFTLVAIKLTLNLNLNRSINPDPDRYIVDC